MHSPISNMQYISKELFQAEQEHLFEKLWIFAGIKSFVAEHNQFIVKQVGSRSVLIQNIEGRRIVAFENRCSHRSMSLQWSQFGKRSLACKFHGWRFNQEGIPFAIPNYNDRYQFSQKELDCLGLKQYNLKIIGHLIFVNIADDPLPIEQQFGSELLEKIQEFSLHFDNEVLHTSFIVNYNWKLGIEVVRDPEHPQFLHTTTLAKTRFLDIKDRSFHPRPYTEKKELPMEKIDIKALSFYVENRIKDLPYHDWFSLVERYGNEDVYYDAILFPSVHLVSGTGGHSFSVEAYTPISENQTQIDLFIMTAKKKEKIPYSPVILLEHLKEGQIVFDEDIEGMEKVHQGMLTGGSCMHGIYEYNGGGSILHYRRFFAHFSEEKGLFKQKEAA